MGSGHLFSLEAAAALALSLGDRAGRALPQPSRDVGGGARAGGASDATGWYVGADYQLARRLWTGACYESAERLDAPELRDAGAA